MRHHVPRATTGWTGSRLQAGSLISTILNLFFQSVKLGIPDHKFRVDQDLIGGLLSANSHQLWLNYAQLLTIYWEVHLVALLCQETRPCGGPADTDCHVGDWHEWTSCSAVCGKGRHTRMRRLLQDGRGGWFIAQ